MATVRVPPILRDRVGGEREVDIAGQTVGEVLERFGERYPGTRAQLFADEGGLNRFVNIYLGSEDVRALDGLGTVVGPDDVVVILPAMAGGDGRPALGRRPRLRLAEWGPGPYTSGHARHRST